ncbi:thioesterase family protein [Roseivirga pacifica]
MKKVFNPGDVKVHKCTVEQVHTATFDAGMVHPVCSTFFLAKEMEWASRLFMLEMTEADEEGIGTMLQIEHRSPALVGDQLEISATVNSFDRNELICDILVKVGDRIIAEGKTGQKILKKEKLNRIFSSLGR